MGFQGKPGVHVDRSTTPAGPSGMAAAGVFREGPAAPQARVPNPAHFPAQSHLDSPAPRLPAGGKAVNTAPVPGQTPHDESDRRTEPRSSVSDLVNSLTSEMLMVRMREPVLLRGTGLGGQGQEEEGRVWEPATAWEWPGRGTGSEAAWRARPSMVATRRLVTECARPGFASQLFHQNIFSMSQFLPLTSENKNSHPALIPLWIEKAPKKTHSCRILAGS